MRVGQIAVLLLGALILTMLLSNQRGVAQNAEQEAFTLAPQGASTGVWVLDQSAARLRLCNPPLQHNQPPDCTPWSQLR